MSLISFDQFWINILSYPFLSVSENRCVESERALNPEDPLHGASEAKQMTRDKIVNEVKVNANLSQIQFYCLSDVLHTAYGESTNDVCNQLRGRERSTAKRSTNNKHPHPRNHLVRCTEGRTCKRQLNRTFYCYYCSNSHWSWSDSIFVCASVSYVLVANRTHFFFSLSI